MTYIPGVATIIGTFIVDNLPTPVAELVGKYARVTDLFGEANDLVLCYTSGGAYYWKPVRPIYAKEFTAPGDMTLYPLKTPTVLFMSGLTAARTITLSNVNAYPGASFEIALDGALGSLNILGTGLGSGLGLLLGARRRIFFTTAATWKQF